MKSILPSAAAGIVLLGVASCGDDSPRYDLHRTVATIATDLGSGLALGEPLGVNAGKVSSPRWVQHAGLVGGASARGLFAQARLYPDPAARALAQIDSSAPVRAIELVSATSSNQESIMFGLTRSLGGVPKEGCLVPISEEAPFRTVQYWTAPGGAGGVAILSDWSDQPAAPHEQVLWSVLAWSGPFNATETLMAAFDPRPCDGANQAFAMKNMSATVEAVEAVEVAFKDSVHGSRKAVADARQSELTNADAPDACMVPTSASRATHHDYHGFSIQLPADFTLRNAERMEKDAAYWGSARYVFEAPDGSAITIAPGDRGILPHGVGGMLSSHCDKVLGAQQAHIDIMNASAGTPDLRVWARFPNAGFEFSGEARSQERQREMLHAVNTIQIKLTWGKASPEALRRPGTRP